MSALRGTRWAHRLIGLGCWLATPKAQRPDWRTFPFRLTGHGALALLAEALDAKELARRHAKPSTRKRVG